MNDADEEKLISIAKPYFENGRAGDWEHACRVVSWIRELGKGRKDLFTLIIAGYLHDSGWSGIAPKGTITMDTLDLLENKANANTEPVVREILSKLKISEEITMTVLRLVAAADRHRSNSEDEAIVVDSDQLSKLCPEHITEKFKPESYKSALEMFEREFSN